MAKFRVTINPFGPKFPKQTLDFESDHFEVTDWGVNFTNGICERRLVTAISLSQDFIVERIYE